MKVLFFDGECILCNRTARWVMHWNRPANLFFAPLQGAFAREKLGDNRTDSLIFLDEGQRYSRSAAVLEILRYMPAWRWLRAARLLPESWLDGVYILVARHRYRWFGRQEVCTIPPPRFRERMITH